MTYTEEAEFARRGEVIEILKQRIAELEAQNLDMMGLLRDICDNSTDAQVKFVCEDMVVAIHEGLGQKLDPLPAGSPCGGHSARASEDRAQDLQHLCNAVSNNFKSTGMDGIIKENKAQCAKCGDIIESKNRHDFVWCKCGAIAVDGGKSYLKRCAQAFEDLIELSTYETEQERTEGDA